MSKVRSKVRTDPVAGVSMKSIHICIFQVHNNQKLGTMHSASLCVCVYLYLRRATDLEQPVVVFRHVGLLELDISSVSVVGNDETAGAKCNAVDFDTSPPPPPPPAESFPISETCPLVEISMQFAVSVAERERERERERENVCQLCVNMDKNQHQLDSKAYTTFK